MKSLTVSRTCPTCSWGTRTETGQMPEPADVSALAVEIAKDLAAELGVLPAVLTPDHRAHVRTLVRQRFFPANVDGSRQTVLTAALATSTQAEMDAQADAALARHRYDAHGLAMPKAKKRVAKKSARKAD